MAKRLLCSDRVKGLTGAAKAFVLSCSVVNHTKLGFKGAQKFEDLTKSKNFCGTLLHKISFMVLAKKIFGVRCTLSLFCLSIPKRDLDTKKIPPNIEVGLESLGATLAN